MSICAFLAQQRLMCRLLSPSIADAPLLTATPPLQDSAVGFQVELESRTKLQARIFLCYDKHAFRSGGSSGCGAVAVSGSEHHVW
jgi:hypothetical protein